MVERERLVKWKNGAKVQPTFSHAEMTRRGHNLRRHMDEARLDAVLLSSYHNINYYADFLYTAFGRHYALVVTLDNAIPSAPASMPAYPATHFGDNVVYTDWRRDNFLHARAAGARGADASASRTTT